MKKRLLILNVFLLFSIVTDAASREWIEATRPTKIYQDLGGEWSYRDIDKRPYFQLPLPKNGWKKCQIPIHKQMESKCIYRWWKRKFKLTDDVKKAFAKGDRAILYLEGRSDRWQLYINGKKLFDSIDPLNPFNIDITDSLQENSENTLVIGTSDRLALCQNNKPKTFIIPKADNDSLSSTIWGEVELRMRPTNRIENIFIKPSWRNKQLDIDIEVIKAGKEWQVGGEIIDKDGKTVLKIPFSNSSKLTNDVRLFTLSQKWTDPICWNVDNPYLYTLKMILKNPDGMIEDEQNIEFGFRELWVKGRDLMMNGRRLFLARKTIWPFTPSTEQIKKLATDYAKARGINTLRVNRGAYYSLGEFAWYADRLGLMLQPQQICAPTSYDLFKTPFWDNYFKFIKRWIRAERNHPSIVMWALSNEALWCLYQKDTKHFISKKLSEAAKVASEVDPTRMSQFDGDWDLPPEGKNPIANLHYPFDPITHCYPTECWKFLNPTEPFPIRGLTGRYNWIGDKVKPMIIGEFIWMWSSGNRPWTDTMYGGDQVFDWEFWRKRKLFNQNLRWFTDVWRVARYAGINPWSHARSHFKYLIPLETVILRDQYRTFFSGEKIDLQAWALNDTPVDHSYTIKWSILKNKKQLFSQSENFNIPAGGIEAFNLHLDAPNVDKPEDMNLKVEIFREEKNEKRFSELWPIRLHPKAPLSWPADSVLFDPTGDTKKLFINLGLKPVVIDSLTQVDNKKAIVIGKNSLDKISKNDLEQTIPEFVKNGVTFFACH